MVRQQNSQQIYKVVRAGHFRAEFFQQRLQVLFRTLLAMKANFVMKVAAYAREFAGGVIIAFRLSHPLPRQLFHTEPCPAPRSRAKTNRLPPNANACSSVSAQ